MLHLLSEHSKGCLHCTTGMLVTPLLNILHLLRTLSVVL